LNNAPNHATNRDIHPINQEIGALANQKANAKADKAPVVSQIRLVRLPKNPNSAARILSNVIYAGVSFSPTSACCALYSLLSFSTCACVVLKNLQASLVRAFKLTISSPADCSASPSNHQAPDSASNEFLSLMSDHIRSSIVQVAASHCLPNHSTNKANAQAASFSHVLAKTSAVTQATSANHFRSCHHLETASLITINDLEIADHPDSALIQTDDKAAPIPNISSHAIHACAPAGHRNLVNDTISASVVAKLLPSSTATDHNSLIDVAGNCNTLANLANEVAACSLDRFVETDNWATVSVNSFI
jgi:hypothetical protein